MDRDEIIKEILKINKEYEEKWLEELETYVLEQILYELEEEL